MLRQIRGIAQMRIFSPPFLRVKPGSSSVHHFSPHKSLSTVIPTASWWVPKRKLDMDHHLEHGPDEPSRDSRFTDSATLPVLEQSSFFEYNHALKIWESKALLLHNSTSSTSVTSQFSVVTWNVDFTGRNASERLTAILSHLQDTIIDPPQASASRVNVPTKIPIILFQEIHYACFSALLAHRMVRDFYALTSISSTIWSQPSSRYGVVILIPLKLTPMLERIFRCPFANSEMARDALFVDLRVHPDKIVRIVTTHLESLRGPSDEARVEQLSIIRDFIHAPGVYGGLVGGDMNPIGPLDVGLTERLGLVDAWVSTREAVAPDTDAEGKEGHTWGYQPLSKFPARRMDKILLSGKLEAGSMERVGVGLKVKVPVFDVRERSKDRLVWASDHYGLIAEISVV